jgi:hemolysin activation/secretion protein
LYGVVDGAHLLTGKRQAPLGSRFKRLAASRILLIASALTGTAAPAQPPVPQQQPVAPTREELQRPAPDSVQARPSRLTVEGGVERAPCALDRPEFSEIRFTLSSVEFEDLRGVSTEALRPAYAPFVGAEHPVSVICEIRDRAATILRDAGYVAAVEVPEQRIADGQVRFQVLMARLVGIRVRGNAGAAESTIAGYLEQLTRQEVFNRFEAERYMLLAGDLPGYDVRLALRSAGAGRGEVIGEVTVVRTPALVDFTVQNLGSSELGRWGGLLRGQFFGLTGLGDRTTVALFSTPDFHEQQTIQLGHDFRVGREGLALGGQATYAWARPDLGNSAVDFESRTLFATIDVNYPFVRRQDRTLRGTVGFDFVNQVVEFNDIPFSRDRLRVGFARLAFDMLGLAAGDARFTPAEPRWRLAALAELRRGFDLFGASEGCDPLTACLLAGAVPPTRLEGNPTATVLRGALDSEVRPMPRLSFALGARGQYSADPLFSFEEFAAGNYTIGRGYDPGTILGDSGVGVSAEIRYGSAYPRGPRQWAWQPFLFADRAWVWNEDVVLAVPSEELTSVGGGVRIAWGDRLRLEATLAVPLDPTALHVERDTRLLISLTTRLWPWSNR